MMATNNSGNRNIEARLVMDSTGNWKIIANTTPPGVVPPSRRQLLKVTGPDGKIKFFYGNNPEEGGLNPIVKQASPMPEMKSKPNENKQLLTESQAKSLAMLLSSVKTQMSSSSSSGTNLVGSVQTSPKTRDLSVVEQKPEKGLNASDVAPGPPPPLPLPPPHPLPPPPHLLTPDKGLNAPLVATGPPLPLPPPPLPLGHGKSNQIVLLVTPGNENTKAKGLQAPVPPASIASRTIQSGSNLVCVNSGNSGKLMPNTMYVIPTSSVPPPPATNVLASSVQSSKKHVAVTHNSLHGRIELGNVNYQMLSQLLKKPDGKPVSEDVSPISTGITNVKQFEIPSRISNLNTARSDRHVDPILSRFDTTSCMPCDTSTTSIPIPVSASKFVDVSAVKPRISVPPPPLSISQSNATNPSSSKEVLIMPKYYMPALVTPSSKPSCPPLAKYSARSGSIKPSFTWSVPGGQQLTVPITHTTKPSSNTSNTTNPSSNTSHTTNPFPNTSHTTNPSSNTSRERASKSGKASAGKTIKDLLNKLGQDRCDKELPNEVADASVEENAICTDDGQSTLRIDSIFSLQHTEDNLEADQKLEVKTEVDSDSSVSSSPNKCGSATEASNAVETKIIKKEYVSKMIQPKRARKRLMINNNLDHSFAKKQVMKCPMLDTFVVLERVHVHDQTANRNGGSGEPNTSKQESPHICSRLCREKLLMQLCREKSIPCIIRLKSEVMKTAKKCRRIRRRVKKAAPLDEGEEVKNEKSNPFDIFLKNLVKRERKRLEKSTNKKTPATSTDESTHAVTYHPYSQRKPLPVGNYRIILHRNSGVVETVKLDSIVPQEGDIPPYVPAPAAFEDIVNADEIPISAEPNTAKLGGNELEVGNIEAVLGRPKSPSSEKEPDSSEACADSNSPEVVVCNTEQDHWNPISDDHEESEKEEVPSELDRESAGDALASEVDEERECVQMDTHPEREQDPCYEETPVVIKEDPDDSDTVVDSPTLTNESVCTEDTLDLHQSDVTMSIDQDSDALVSEDEVVDIKAVETPPKDEDSDDDWGVAGLEVDPDSEHEEDMDILCPGLPPDVTESVSEPEEEVVNSRRDNHSANVGGNERIQQLKAKLEEQTRQVNSLRRLRRCTR